VVRDGCGIKFRFENCMMMTKNATGVFWHSHSTIDAKGQVSSVVAPFHNRRSLTMRWQGPAMAVAASLLLSYSLLTSGFTRQCIRVPRRIKLQSFSSALSSSSSSLGRTILDDAPHPSDGGTENSKHDWQYILHLAEDAATRAGSIMRATTGRISSTQTKSNVRDLVTESDVASQQIIFSTINAVRPNDVFLGEEAVDPGSEASIEALRQALITNDGDDDDDDRLLWIVDPIDGTTVSINDRLAILNE
jgi:DNA-binding transcriptional regulator YdaS (Cro superfamily)